MVDEKTDVRKILGGFDHVPGMVIVGIGSERQALVDTDPAQAEFSRFLENGIGDLFIVHPPSMLKALAWEAGIELQRFDLERLDLRGQVVFGGLLQLRRGESM